MEHAKFVERAVKTGYALSLSCTFPLLMFSLKEHLFSICGWGEPTDKMWRFYLVSARQSAEPACKARPWRSGAAACACPSAALDGRHLLSLKLRLRSAGASAGCAPRG